MTDKDTSGAPKRGPGGDFGIRLLSSVILIPLALFGAWWGGLPAFVLVAAVSVIVLAEWCFVTGHSARLFERSSALVVGSVFVAAATLVGGIQGAGAGLALLIIGAALGFAISRSSLLAVGVLYSGLFGLSLAAIRSDPTWGLKAIVVLLVLVWVTDSAAYVVGRSFGGPKLWPRVSPKKTWSGSIGGLVIGVVLAGGVAFAMAVPVGPVFIVLLFVLSIVSQIGDLAESALKRRFGKKDASGIIPGHGGMMDRVDGLIFAAALALLVSWAHGTEHALGQGLLLW